jgi:hypothetical protein
MTRARVEIVDVDHWRGDQTRTVRILWRARRGSGALSLVRDVVDGEVEWSVSTHTHGTTLIGTAPFDLPKGVTVHAIMRALSAFVCGIHRMQNRPLALRRGHKA